jgi:hypothetical protein
MTMVDPTLRHSKALHDHIMYRAEFHQALLEGRSLDAAKAILAKSPVSFNRRFAAHEHFYAVNRLNP